MFRRISKFTRILAVGALAAGIVGGLLPIGRAGATTAAVVTVTPTTAGLAAQYSIAFGTLAPGTLLAEDVGQIIITFPAGTTVPATIPASAVSVSSAGGPLTPTTSVGTNTLAPVAPSVSGRVVTITVPVAIAAATAGHAVQFSNAAGIINPATAGAAFVIGVATAATGTPEANVNSGAYAITSLVSLSATSGARSTSVTATGRGFTSGSTATLWLDNGPVGGIVGGVAANGVQDGTEPQLGSQATVGTDGTFTATFNATGLGWVAGANTVQAKDGTGAVAGTAGTFTILGTVTLTPSSGNIGSTVSISVSDFAVAPATIAGTTFGGIAAAMTPAAPALSAAGAVTYTIVVPAAASLGVNTIAVTPSAGAVRTATYTVTAIALTATPSTVVPGQSVSLSGAGFAPSTVAGGGGPNAVHQILVGGPITLNALAVGDAGADDATDGTVAYPINLDSGGNLVAQITLPTAGSILTAGTYTLRVVDDTGRVGEATLTIPSRTLTVSPTSSTRGTTVTFTGTGFGANSTAALTYALAPQTTVATDASGNFSGSFTVPIAAAIPSTNNVTATSGSTGSTRTATHSVPTSSITATPASTNAGGTISITGTSFPAFSVVTAVTIGGIGAIPSPAPATDANGMVTFNVLVPQVPIGTNALAVTAGGSTANVSITVAQAPQTVQGALTNLGTNLVRVWGYDPAANAGAGGFKLYDPAAAAASDLSTLVAGQGYWVRVNTAQTVVLGSFSYTLSAGWNLIGWRG